MRVTEKLVKSPEEEGVTLAYIRLTKDFEEIKEYVQHKGDQYNAGGMFDCMYWFCRNNKTQTKSQDKSRSELL